MISIIALLPTNRDYVAVQLFYRKLQCTSGVPDPAGLFLTIQEASTVIEIAFLGNE
ncbi:hypothetical protein YDYSY3_06490 [Paenibacillus chitinolyticus]|nr:hypothetical protein YDYSY3_06490 [Paenibacillus chitinolyticus]